MTKSIRRVRCAALIAVTIGVCVALTHAAGPRAMMFHSGALTERRFYTDWYENASFMHTITPVEAPRALETRPSIEFTMFSGPQWERATAGNRPWSDINSNEGSPRGHFYPAMRETQALLVQTYPSARAWLISRAGLDYLKKGGVPIEIQR
jgi:hypothetical protein